eukprot:gene9374-6593_t
MKEERWGRDGRYESSEEIENREIVAADGALDFFVCGCGFRFELNGSERRVVQRHPE